ncbi:MAG: hypothetical protein GX967_04235 [Clostridiales bacterium]|nr:hypothetical protein [Clostridiales bacterium]
MQISEIASKSGFTIINRGQDIEAYTVYCCDLLSIVMSNAPEGAIWFTVMGNVNSVAVSVLSDIACIVLAHGSSLDEDAMQKAKEQDVWVLQTELPIFDAANTVNRLINA